MMLWKSIIVIIVIIVIIMIVRAGEKDTGAPVQKGGETAVWGGKLAAGNQDVHAF